MNYIVAALWAMLCVQSFVFALVLVMRMEKSERSGKELV